MKEIEIKILGISKQEFLAKMKEIKAKKFFAGLMKVNYWDFANGKIHKAGALLRTRESSFAPHSGASEDKRGNEGTEVVFKKKKENIEGLKQREEIELMVDDGEKIKKIFQNMGLKITKSYEKKRMEFKLKDIKFDFDEYPNGFCYLEVEGKTKEQVIKMVQSLGWDKKEKSAKTADSLFIEMFGKDILNGLKF